MTVNLPNTNLARQINDLQRDVDNILRRRIPTPGGAGGGGSSDLIGHSPLLGYSHVCTGGGDQYANGDVGTLSLLVPAEGNIFVSFVGIGAMTFKSPPADATVVAHFDFAWIVDGAPGSPTPPGGGFFGYEAAFSQQKFNTWSGGTIYQNMATTTTIACPAAATRTIIVNATLNGDVQSLGHYNFASLVTRGGMSAVFVPGTPISDGGDFTP